MSGRILLDTNVWIYALTTDDPVKKAVANSLVSLRFDDIVTTPLILAETLHVLCRKSTMPHDDALKTVESISTLFPLQEVGKGTFSLGLSIKGSCRYSIWDSLVLASALEAGCSTIYSEDMQHGHVINQVLTIVNPFKS